MEHMRLGRTGLQVSRLCLGTANFGAQCDAPTSERILERAFEQGISFIDTADIYPLSDDMVKSAGRTEQVIGPWVSRHRDDIIIASKCHGRTGPNAWDAGLSRKHILSAVEDSLRRLQTDYLDLLQLHGFDDETPIEETLATLDVLVRSGKVRYIGCSTSQAYRIAQATGKSELRGFERFSSVQTRYSLLARHAEIELFPCAEDEGVSVLPFNILAGGMLTGKHQRDLPAEGSRFTTGKFGPKLYRQRYWHEAEFEVIDELRVICDELGRSMTELATAWALAQPAVVSAVVGASRPEQLDAPVAAVGLQLDDELFDRLNKLTSRFLHVGNKPNAGSDES